MKRIVRATAVALALGSSILVAGCSPGTAAVAGGRTITVDEVNSAVVEINEAMQPQTPVTAPQVLTYLVRAPEVLAYAAQQGRAVTPSIARTLIPLNDPSPSTVEIVQYAKAVESLTDQDSAELTKRLTALEVTVNPKFGTWSAERAGVAPDQPNWLTATPK